MSRGIRTLIAVVGLTVLIGAGQAEAKFIPGLNRVKADRGEIYRYGCMVGHTRVRSGACRFGDRRSDKKVVLFGDSHAMQWGPGLIRLAKEKHWQVIALTRANCPAALVRIDYYCDRWRRNSLERIRRMQPGLVVVASAANYKSYRVASNPSRISSEPVLVDGMIRVLRRLRRWSPKTVVIRDPAVTPFNVTMCLRSNVRTPSKCSFRPHRPRRWAYDYKATRRVKGVRLIDSQPMLCRRGSCPPVKNDYLIYRNQGHLSASFVRAKYQWLGEKLPDPWRR